MTSPEDVIYWARKLTGRTYLFGGELTGATPGPCDCSELVEYACRNAGAPITDGSWLQFQACDTAGLRVPFDRARRTPGALLFMSRTPAYPPPDGRNGIYHVAIVTNHNETIEACCSNGDRIGPRRIDGRTWYPWGGLIPGVTYPEGDGDMLSDDDKQWILDNLPRAMLNRHTWPYQDNDPELGAQGHLSRIRRQLDQVVKLLREQP